MKALSLWPHWAYLVAVGGKLIETRSWATKHRGPLAICASQIAPRAALHMALNNVEISRFLQGRNMLDRRFPSGCVMAVCELVDCIRITSAFVENLSALELAAGDYTLGRYAWRLDKVNPLRVPLLVRGRQGLYDVSGVCRVCGCTDFSICVERTCDHFWVEPDLCSACARPMVNINAVHSILSDHRLDTLTENLLWQQMKGEKGVKRRSLIGLAAAVVGHGINRIA
ncbi:hypothetical protein Ppro_3755 (plasmid) [Pelobacter propionicus DSM 2379]|uniref:Uncharacterized protein n=1 Tax=Pelobacter propionicus (strain DSM 2379 / NBRC 103807 / OttBd1) TaxID=338966 RepID=A0R7V2_PELPD|nr:hypothetical protein Ppro_3755 [Pelobacter propionicus DSM 2379]